jgi:cytochrome P450/NADPH-cytochrome P450 reductase
MESLAEVAQEYGGICQLKTPMGRLIVVSDPALAAELCDEERFDKVLGPGLQMVRKRIGDGLFTAWTHEKNWGLAHRILMPTFSHASMQAYVPDMVELAFQLMETLDNASLSGSPVDIPVEMTNLTLDTIALCGFSYRFNSFHRESQHPFVKAMLEVLTEQQNQAVRPAALNKVMIGARRRLEASSKVMGETVIEIIRQRREAGPLQGREDLLEHMLHGVDKVSGESLSDENIKFQCITFLIAGHETTSGLLSFATYYLMKNPAIAARAQAEADRVLGTDLSRQPTYEQIHSLDFIQQVLEEALRLWPTAPAFTRGPRQEPGEVIGGKYFIPYGEGCQIILGAVHRSPQAWGADAQEFNPDRFSAQAKASRLNAVYFPFGTGERACIGRQFAMQEAKLVMGMLLQRFELVDSEGYQLRIKQSLTIKPDGFRLKLRRRPASPSQVAAPLVDSAENPAPTPPAQAARLNMTVQVVYGSNLGTCETLANDLAHQAEQLGFDVKPSTLDEAAGQLGQGPVLIVCSSYNGVPPDNAAHFVAWLEQAQNLEGVRYAVFGCGNREWSNTYQKVPRQLDSALAGKGARRLLALAEGDASGDLDGAFRDWKRTLWASLSQELDVPLDSSVAPAEPLYSMEILEELHPNPFAEVYQATPMVVVDNRELQDTQASGRSTRHIELAMPEGSTYKVGDHLGVIPKNSRALVARVAAAFGLNPEIRIKLHKRRSATAALPTDRILAVGTLLTHYLELQEVATRHHLEILAGYMETTAEKKKLLALAGDAERYAREVQAPRKSIVDLVEEFPSTRLPFAHYLQLASALKPRYYSISSSPEASGRILSVTVGVVDGPAHHGNGRFQGCCSNYLAGIPRGHSVYAFVQDAHGTFGLPASSTLPLVMVGAGTGVAPYRGFLQERAAQRKAGRNVAKSLLFFGCRHSQHDHIYRQEMLQYEQDGLVKIVTAFSRETETKVYVQDRLRDHSARIWEALEQGGLFYVCGDAAGMAAGVRKALAAIVSEQGEMTASESEAYLDRLAADGRYMLDVWAS